MSALPLWIVDALDRWLPHMRGGERDKLAAVILEALPKAVIVEAIASSAKATLTRRAIRDDAGDLSRDIAENAAQTVIALLSIAEEPPCEVCDGDRFLEVDEHGNEELCFACRGLGVGGKALDECADCGASTAPGTPDPHVCGASER